MGSRRRRWWAPLVLAFLLVLAGCGGNAGSGGGAGSGGEAATGTTAGAGGGGDDASTGKGTTEAVGSGNVLQVETQQRTLVRTGRVALTVGNVSSTQAELARLVRRSGGFVSDSRVRRDRSDGRTWVTGRLVVRVPAENFSTVFTRIERAGEVRASNTSTEDVSEQLVDIEARLENLRAQRERLREFYARANDTEGLLAIQERLSDVQSRIERLEARQQSLRRQVALSTIVIDLAERVDETDETRDAWYETGVVAAFLDSVSGVGIVLRALVVGIAYLLPYLLAFGVPAALALYAIRYRRRGDTV